jgi:hypothetical protein
VNFLPKLKIEIAVPSELVDAVIEAISGAARTGKIGDGQDLRARRGAGPCASAPGKSMGRRCDARGHA